MTRSSVGIDARVAASMMALVLAAGCTHGHAAAVGPPRPRFDRATPPVLGPPPALVLPPVVNRRLSNGLRLVIVERHALPLADFILITRTGAESDPEGRAGVATLTADVLLRGTTTRSATDIAEQRAMLGISLTTGSTWDNTFVSMHTPTVQLDSALALFADVTLHPAFTGEEVERARRERLTRLVQLSDVGRFVADRVESALLYGPTHPYGHPPLGTDVSVGAASRSDLRSFYGQAFRPGNSTLIVVGDLLPDDVERRAKALFGAWATDQPAGSAPGHEPATWATPAPSGPTTIYLVDKADAPQSSIRIGALGVARNTPDYFALTVLNSALGGAFTSRLNQNLRETHGYTYGAFSDFDMRRQAGPFSAEAEVVASKTDSSMREFMNELQSIRDTIPVVELNKTKRYLELQLPGEFETTTDIAEQLAPVVLYGLPNDFYNTYQAHVAAVTQADVHRVAQRYIDPAHLTVVVVGDRKTVEAPLRAIGLGPVEIRHADGSEVRQ